MHKSESPESLAVTRRAETIRKATGCSWEYACKLAELERDGAMVCECSEDFGPCETHGDTLVIREGASLHTADELTMIEIGDWLDVGANISVWGRAELARLESALEDSRDPVSGTAWFADEDDADSARSLAWQLENDQADVWIIREDGYVMVRPHADCPLLDR